MGKFIPILVLAVCSTAALSMAGEPEVTGHTASAEVSSTMTLNSNPAPERSPGRGEQTAELPVGYQATYKTSYNGIPITTSRRLTRNGDNYVLSMLARNFVGTISEEERFVITGGGDIEPRSYAYKRNIFGQKRKETTDFANGTAVNVYKETTVKLPVDDSILGPMSYQFQMRQDLMNGKEDFSYRVVSRNHIKDYRYQIIDREQLDTPLGRLDTVVIERVRDDSERETYLWLASNLDYLPVKLVQKEDGESYEMLVDSYSIDPDGR